jgi:hypothetical protein
VLLKEFLPIIVISLTLLLAAEVILLKSDILSRRKRGSEVGWSFRYNKNVERTLTWILRIYRNLGFNYKSSNTIREILRELAGKLPDQSESLTVITHSLEDHIYGGSEIKKSDLIYYSRWISFAKKYVKS